MEERRDALEAARWLVTGVIADLSNQSASLIARRLLELELSLTPPVQSELEAVREPRVLHAQPRAR